MISIAQANFKYTDYAKKTLQTAKPFMIFSVPKQTNCKAINNTFFVIN